MNHMSKCAAWSRVAWLLAVLQVAPGVAFGQPANPSGPLRVRVTNASNGAAVANATVCIGVASNLNQFHRGSTDPQGNVRFDSVPREPFVATANVSGRGTQRSFAPASPNLSLLNIELVLPESGGPSCGSTGAGSARSLGPDTANIRRQAAERLRNAPALSRLPEPTNVRTEHCFGAVGAECGQPQTGLPATAACASGTCLVNGGSWDHDECCFRNRHVAWCELDPARQLEAAKHSTCTAAWNKAVRLTTKGLSWSRAVDFSRGNRTGTVEFALYCAPANTLVPPEDGSKCCSRQTRALNVGERAAALAAGETLLACR
ncbi:MAG: carboxypeptidase regulatory-like domain-containing protein [Ideonella sp.]|nr:carboxypeptidase regulatory-like domain-containing protein [Ideonella sp.]MCC7457318.1 carboxypeptidase regulatory-like domain-containing protein [Nitrospira sp.]